MDKYPELEESYAANDVDGDFLRREKELLGDATGFQGAAESSPESAAESSAEQSQFEHEYPPLDAADAADASADAPAATSASASASPPGSQFIQEWEVKHELEVERRDKVSQEKQQETRAKAQAAIDDFYANYNTKREEALKKVEEDAEKFVAARDEQNTGSTWDKAAAIIEAVGKPAEGVTPADKQRFRELVNGLKGDADAPGAAGY